MGLVAGALDAGLSLQDFNIMTIGMILEYMDECYELRMQQMEINNTEEETVREATQADFDCF